MSMRRNRPVSDPARELEDELRFHFESVVAELEASGLSRREAEAAARRRFGDEARYRRELERIDRGVRRRHRLREARTAMETGMRSALQSVKRSPGLSVGVVLAFALGIGANATMFGIVDRLLLSPPAHIEAADEVVRLVLERTPSFGGARVQTQTMAWADYQDFHRLEQFAGVAGMRTRAVMVGRGEAAWEASAVYVSANFFDLLGVRPRLGRFFDETEDRPGAAGVAVIGHSLWRSRFAGSESVLGQTIDFGYGEYTIVGVAPEGFTGTGLGRVDIWAPLETAGRAAMGEQWFTDDRNYSWISAVARLAPGTTAAVAADAATAVHRAGRADPIARGDYDPEVRVVMGSLIAGRGLAGGGGTVVGGISVSRPRPETRVALWLTGVSAIVLLIACVNVANLLVARGVRQQREIAIRLALGIPRRRLVGQTLVEGLILGALGGVAALLVARWGGDLVRTTLLPNVEWLDGGVTLRVLPVVLALSVLAGLLAALVPALETTRRDPAETLRATSGGITRSTSRIRAVLTMAQAALSVVLLVGAALFIRSLREVRSLDLGFDMDGLLVATTVEDGAGLPVEENRRLFRDAEERIARMPGVQGVAYSVSIPFNWSSSYGLRIPGRDSLPRPSTGGPYVHVVSREYFRTMDLRVLRGRGFEDGDFATGQRATVVNETMAKMYWPTEEPQGACLQIDGYQETPPTIPCTTVVGVVEDARRGSVIEPPTPQYYLPVTHEAASGTVHALFIRAPRADGAFIAALRQSILALEPRLRYVRIEPLAESTVSELRSWRLGATMFTVFGGLALLVAALGLYSVLAFDVAQRRREIGLRSALGASARRLVLLVMTRAFRLTAAGLAIGIIAALILAPQLESLLFETSPRDPLSLFAVAVVLILVSLAAGGIPALRAVRVDPNIALRSE